MTNYKIVVLVVTPLFDSFTHAYRYITINTLTYKFNVIIYYYPPTKQLLVQISRCKCSLKSFSSVQGQTATVKNAAKEVIRNWNAILGVIKQP